MQSAHNEKIAEESVQPIAIYGSWEINEVLQGDRTA